MMILIILALSLVGCAAFCLAMNRHARQLKLRLPLPPAKRRRFVYGCVLLASALLLSIDTYGVSIGITAWFGFLSLAVASLALFLSYGAEQLGKRLTKTSQPVAEEDGLVSEQV